jgi:AcrR family transcriptional regulator
MISAMSSATPYPVAARELLRNSLLDAAVEQLERQPWGRVTMGDIATTAGVSRQTLYKEFRSRNAFVQALVLREVDRFLDPVAVAIAQHVEDPRTAVSSALGTFLDTAAGHPLIRTVVAGEGTDELLRLFTTRGSPVIHRAVGRLTDILLEGWPQVQRADAALFAECMVRLAVSLAALPESPTGMAPDAIADLFAPYIEKMLAEAGG